MDPNRPVLQELADPRNRDIVATNTPKLWAAYRRAMNRAEYFLSIPHPTRKVKDKDGRDVPAPLYARQLAKIQALQAAMHQTVSMDGRGLDAMTAVGVGSKAPAVAVGINQPRTADGTPYLGAPT